MAASLKPQIVVDPLGLSENLKCSNSRYWHPFARNAEDHREVQNNQIIRQYINDLNEIDNSSCIYKLIGSQYRMEEIRHCIGPASYLKC